MAPPSREPAVGRKPLTDRRCPAPFCRAKPSRNPSDLNARNGKLARARWLEGERTKFAQRERSGPHKHQKLERRFCQKGVAPKPMEPIVATGGSRSRIVETIFLVLGIEGSPLSLNNHGVLRDEPDGAWAARPLELIREGGRTVLDGFAITDRLRERARGQHPTRRV